MMQAGEYESRRDEVMQEVQEQGQHHDIYLLHRAHLPA
jgi:hypothetical protein